MGGGQSVSQGQVARPGPPTIEVTEDSREYNIQQPLQSRRRDHEITVDVVEVPLASRLTPLGFITPIQQASPRLDEQCLPYTPVGDEALVFCYYCPLCMQHFKSILKSSECCGHYICKPCCEVYMASKGTSLQQEAEKKGDDTGTSIACPHCSTFGFKPNVVSSSETPRNYAITPVKKNLFDRDPQASPLKAGDDFDSLKRKMVPYRQQQLQQQLQRVNSGIGIAQAVDFDGGAPDYVVAEIKISESHDRETIAEATTDAGVSVLVEPDVNDIFHLSPDNSPLKQQATNTVHEVFEGAFARFGPAGRR